MNGQAAGVFVGAPLFFGGDVIEVLELDGLRVTAHKEHR